MARILTSEIFHMGFAAGVIITIHSIPERSEVTAADSTTTSPEAVGGGQNHPFIMLFGKYRNEPLWEGFEEAIRTIREQETHT